MRRTAHHTACRVLLGKKFPKVFYQVWSLLFSKMSLRCVAAGCSNTTKDSVSLHRFPSDTKYRRIWTTKVKLTRAKWSGPTERSFVLHTSSRHALNGAFTASSVWLIRPCCYDATDDGMTRRHDGTTQRATVRRDRRRYNATDDGTTRRHDATPWRHDAMGEGTTQWTTVRRDGRRHDATDDGTHNHYLN